MPIPAAQADGQPAAKNNLVRGISHLILYTRSKSLSTGLTFLFHCAILFLEARVPVLAQGPRYTVRSSHSVFP